MKILISGSHGLIASELIPILQAKGHKIGRLIRDKADITKNEIFWNAERGSLDKSALQEFAPDAVIHLAGEGIADGRWTEERKRKIRDTRVNGTKILAQALATLESPPQVFISGSAVGFYGNRGDEKLDETSSAGEGFLAEVAQDWEANTQAAESKGIRVVHIRTGIVLSEKGGALQKMLLPFRLGLGGVIGHGRQYMSWISLEDEVRAIVFALENDSVRGAVNLTAPNPVTNKEFTKSLGKVLLRPTIFPLPASIARMAFSSEMADETLLTSIRVYPKKLQDLGFQFHHANLREALRSILKSK
ncbi:MAG: TIGR01777 family protein [Deltaproteobacteria bacterium]|nr:TIGR01777 family protein [Deltaproteobacteria bacterium]